MSLDEQGRKVGFAERVHLNQQHLASHLKSNYDFIVCGFGILRFGRRAPTG